MAWKGRQWVLEGLSCGCGCPNVAVMYAGQVSASVSPAALALPWDMVRCGHWGAETWCSCCVCGQALTFFPLFLPIVQ